MIGDGDEEAVWGKRDREGGREGREEADGGINDDNGGIAKVRRDELICTNVLFLSSSISLVPMILEAGKGASKSAPAVLAINEAGGSVTASVSASRYESDGGGGISGSNRVQSDVSVCASRYRDEWMWEMANEAKAYGDVNVIDGCSDRSRIRRGRVGPVLRSRLRMNTGDEAGIEWREEVNNGEGGVDVEDREKTPEFWFFPEDEMKRGFDVNIASYDLSIAVIYLVCSTKS